MIMEIKFKVGIIILVFVTLSNIGFADNLLVRTDKEQYMVGESAIIEIYLENSTRINDDVFYKLRIESQDPFTKTNRMEVHKEFQNEITLDSNGYGSDKVTIDISNELKFDRVFYIVLEVDDKKAASTFRVRPAYDLEIECDHLVEKGYGEIRLTFTNEGNKSIRNINVELNTPQNLKVVDRLMGLPEKIYPLPDSHQIIALIEFLLAEKTKSISDLMPGENRSRGWTVEAIDAGYSQLRFTINSDGGSGELTHPVSIESAEEFHIKGDWDVRIPFNKTGNVTVIVTNLVDRPINVSLEMRLYESCVEGEIVRGIAKDIKKCVEMVDDPIKKIELDASSTNTGRMTFRNVSWRVKGVDFCYNSYVVIPAGLKEPEMCRVYGDGNILVLEEDHDINLTVYGKKIASKEIPIFLRGPTDYSIEVKNLGDKYDIVDLYVYPNGTGWTTILYDNGSATRTSPHKVELKPKSSRNLTLELTPYPNHKVGDNFSVDIMAISERDRRKTSGAEAYAELVSAGGDIKVKPTRFHVNLSTKFFKEIRLELTNIGSEPIENISVDIPPFHGKTLTSTDIQIQTIHSLMPGESRSIKVRIEAPHCKPGNMMSDIVVKSSLYNISVPLLLDISQTPYCFVRELAPSYVYIFLIFLVILIFLMLINTLLKSKSHNILYPSREKIIYFVIMSIIPQIAIIIPGFDFSFSLHNFLLVSFLFISAYFLASLFDRLPLSKKKTLAFVILSSIVSTALMDPSGPLGSICGSEDVPSGCECLGIKTTYGDFDYRTEHCTGICHSCDLSNCYYVTDRDRRDACFSGIVRSSNSVDYCESLVIDRDKCIRELAMYRNSFELCTTIVDQEIRDDCIGFIAAVNADVSLCENIDDIKGKDSCYIRVAVQNNVLDAGICARINNSEKRDYCYNILARILSDSDLCGEIESVSERDQCYKNSAIKSGNPIICDNIRDESKFIKEDCLMTTIKNNNAKGGYNCDIIRSKHYQNLCVLYTTGVRHSNKLKNYCNKYDEVELCINDTVRFRYKDIGFGYEGLNGTTIASCGKKPSDIPKCLELKNLTCITIC